MVESNTAPLGTNYTVPVDHRSTPHRHHRRRAGPHDPGDLRSRRASRPTSRGPGHLFPLVAKEGGVLRRAGHTEAAVDLARMAGLMPAGVLCEILDEHGRPRQPRRSCSSWPASSTCRSSRSSSSSPTAACARSSSIRQAEAELPTKYGTGTIIAYGVKYETQQPIVLVIGDPTKVAAPLVRLHSSCFTGDLLESLRCDCGDQLHMALDMISREGAGVLVYLPQEGRGIGLVEKIKAYALQDQGLDTVEANLALGYKADPRDYGVGIQLLKDLGLRKVRLLTNNPKKTDAFIYGGFDLEVVDQVPIVGPIHEHNAGYLATKRDKMGHHLPGRLSVGREPGRPRPRRNVD